MGGGRALLLEIYEWAYTLINYIMSYLVYLFELVYKDS